MSEIQRPPSVPRGIRQGVTLLNHRVPRWWGSIDLETLCMSCPGECLLAHLYGDYEEGLHALSLSYEDAYQYGFNKHGSGSWMPLQKGWKQVVQVLQLIRRDLQELHASIARGMAFLDEQDPVWWQSTSFHEGDDHHTRFFLPQQVKSHLGTLYNWQLIHYGFVLEYPEPPSLRDMMLGWWNQEIQTRKEHS